MARRTGSQITAALSKKVEDKIYTIEGNGCSERTYTIGYYELLEFGIPAY